MSVIIFITVSAWEWFALLILAFALYRFEIREHLGQLAFASFLLALFSFTWFEVFHLFLFATFIQPIVVFLFFWLIFKIPVFYAGIVVINGYLAYIVASAIVYKAFEQFGIIAQPATPSTYVMQIITGILILLLSRVIFQFRLGFSFVQHGHEVRNITGINLKLLLITFLGYAVLSVYNLLYFGANYKLPLLIVTFVMLVYLEYWTLKKEYEAAFSKRNKKYRADFDA